MNNNKIWQTKSLIESFFSQDDYWQAYKAKREMNYKKNYEQIMFDSCHF